LNSGEEHVGSGSNLQSRLDKDPFTAARSRAWISDSASMIALGIDLAATDKRRRPDKPLHGSAQSGVDQRFRLDDCGASFPEREHPESHDLAPS
jgi:hypothetical protein